MNPATGLAAGSYMVTVTNQRRQLPVMTGPITVDATTAPSIDGVVTSDETCSDSDGAVTLTVTGGTGSYLFNWEEVSTLAYVSTTNPATGLPAGIYGVTVTNDDGSCPVAPAIAIAINQTGFATISSTNTTNEFCGQSDGSITLTIMDGIGPFNFEWENTANPGVIVSMTNPATGLPAGDYVGTVTNNNGGCPVITPVVNIPETPGPVIDNTASTEASCNQDNGSITVIVSSGVGPFNFAFEDVTTRV